MHSLWEVGLRDRSRRGVTEGRRTFENLDCLPLELASEVNVPHRRAQRPMPHELLNLKRVGTLHCQVAAESVPEVVPAYPPLLSGDACRSERSAKWPFAVTIRQGTSIRLRKDELGPHPDEPPVGLEVLHHRLEGRRRRRAHPRGGSGGAGGWHLLAWRNGVAGLAAMRVSVSGWATTEADIDRSAEAILGCLRAAERSG